MSKIKPTKKNATAETVAERIANLRGLYGQPKATPSAPARKGWTDNPQAAGA